MASLAAVATVGGGASIPLITQRLSERLRAPVVTTQSQLNVAAGAALLADRGLSADAPTGMASAADAPTDMATAAWPAARPEWRRGVAADGAQSATFRALAWSQDDAPADEPGAVYRRRLQLRLRPGSHRGPPAGGVRPGEEGYPPEPAPLPWYKRPPILFGAAAAAALLAIGGLAVTLTNTSGNTGPVTETATTVSTEPSPGQPTIGHLADGDGDRARRPADHHRAATATAADDDHGTDDDHDNPDDNRHHDGPDHHDHPAHNHPAHNHPADHHAAPTTATTDHHRRGAHDDRRRPDNGRPQPWPDRRRKNAPTFRLPRVPSPRADRRADRAGQDAGSGGIGAGKSSVLAVVRATLRTAGVTVVTSAPLRRRSTDARRSSSTTRICWPTTTRPTRRCGVGSGVHIRGAAEALTHHPRLRALQPLWNGRTPWCRSDRCPPPR